MGIERLGIYGYKEKWDKERRMLEEMLSKKNDSFFFLGEILFLWKFISFTLPLVFIVINCLVDFF